MTNEDDVVVPKEYVPQETEPYMSLVMKTYFKRQLLKWREEVSTQAKRATDALHEETGKNADVLDEAVNEIRLETEFIPMLSHENDLLVAIDGALLKINKGTYGFCEQTGKPIGVARLKAWPIAALCIDDEE